ncbi:MAG: hypothetical protein Ta2B_05380 [Termitinemataceae bacterium]|nr:MAG: hypothetical protein Ta2B_05380 [Termitinemataceae bacterium]
MILRIVSLSLLGIGIILRIMVDIHNYKEKKRTTKSSLISNAG